MKIEVLNEIESELERFKKRLISAKNRIKEDKFAIYGSKETAALKRSALDLKAELTRITR